MPAPDPNTMEARVAELENQVRALRAGNLTDLASVVNASGQQVPLSSLAFGQVIGTNAVTSAFSGSTVANQIDPGYGDPTHWTYTAPVVDAYVNGGSLRVDWGALLAINGNPANGPAPVLVMSYRVWYRGLVNDGSVNNPVINPDWYRSILLYSSNAGAVEAAMGTFYRHSGLTPGWYRAQPAYYLGYASSATTVPASSDYPRIALTPL